ncbi:MAG: TetR/AcrR family transcriptional regulator C-terminal domain-containing protein [Microthrixaceae bacterium]
MSRVPRGTLSRERVVEAALELIDESGTEALSMPKLARHLGVGVMSLYTHVESKDDLLDAVVQRVLESLAPPSGVDWAERIRSHFAALRSEFLAHPGLGAVFATKNVATEAVLELLEENLADLTASGLPDREAVQLYYSCLAFTLGFVSWELPRTQQLEPPEYAQRWHLAIASTSAETHPTLHRLEPHLVSVASPGQFDEGLRRLTSSVALPAQTGRDG